MLRARRPAAAAAGGREGAASCVELPGAEECCGFGGTFAVKNPDVSAAMGADKVRNIDGDRRRGAVRGRQLLPDAHRRHPDPARARAIRPVHIAEILAEHGGGRRSADERHVPGHAGLPAGRRTTSTRDTQLRGNLRHATHTIRAKRAEGRRRAGRLGRSCARRAPRSRTARCAISTTTWCSWRRRSPRPAARCTGPPTPTRPTGSSPSWSRRPARREVVKVKSMATQEIGLNEALAEAGHPRLRDRPRRADRAARRRPARRTSWSRPSTATAAEIRDIFREQMGEWGRPAPEGLTDDARRPGRGGPAAPAGEVPARQGRHLRRQLHGRRDRHPGRRGVRGQRPDVPDPARDADLRRRHREGRADLAGPGGLPPDAAPLLHRRADEPVHLDVDRHHGRATARGPSTWCCSTTAAPTPSPTGRPPGAALHPLLGLPERLPGLRAGRRPRLRLGLPRPDRRHPHPATAGHRRASWTPRCRTPRRCAAPATRCARWPSTSPRCWCTCGSGSSRAAR